MELGTYLSVSEEIGDICGDKDNAKGIINDDVTIVVTDINRDGCPDLEVTLKQLNCSSGKNKISQTNFLASSRSFKSGKAKDPKKVGKRLLKAQKQALEEFARTKNQQTAAKILEKADVWQNLYEKPVGLSTAA